MVWSHLSHYCSILPYVLKNVRAGKINWGIAFHTRRLPCITELHNLFYVNKKKVIPSIIYDNLTPIALVHLIAGMDQPRMVE
jgi:hypothetical protein